VAAARAGAAAARGAGALAQQQARAGDFFLVGFMTGSKICIPLSLNAYLCILFMILDLILR
jgi:hypothetical protein